MGKMLLNLKALNIITEPGSLKNEEVRRVRNLNYLNDYRVSYMGDMGNEHNGVFKIPRGKNVFVVIASSDMGWQHVSLSLQTNTGKILERCPKWSEMCELKELFFEDEEVAMQLHPKKSQYVNLNPYVLHLWRPLDEKIPLPPLIIV
jgi:hypothetical protein